MGHLMVTRLPVELSHTKRNLMTDTLKEYHFTDEQIDMILKLARIAAFDANWGSDDPWRMDYTELANQIEDQIVNHPTNS